MDSRTNKIYYLLTALITGGLIGASSLITVSVPPSYSYQTAVLDGPYQIFDPQKHQTQYDSLRIEIRTQQFRLAEYYRKASQEQKSEILSRTEDYLFRTIKNQIFPFWYHTQWDFNGTTERPRQGAIACGYFVTTVLRHVGFHYEKYYLSRLASRQLIQKVCLPSSIHTIRENNTDSLYAYLEAQEPGLYILGLAKHVGFIVKSAEGIYYVHSRGPRRVGVVKEEMRLSSAIQDSEIYVLGNVLKNPDVILSWLSNLPSNYSVDRHEG